MRRVKSILRPFIPSSILDLRRRLVRKFRAMKAAAPLAGFVLKPIGTLGFRRRLELARRMARAHENISCKHTHAEMIEIVRAILALPADLEGCLVEAGCYKGGSTAKLSIVAGIVGRRLVVFDSFEGIPRHDEEHGYSIRGERAVFREGAYRGELEEVEENVSRWGEIGSCEFVKGWFDDTMPGFDRDIAIAFLDVDLASSTRTCLRYLYPRLVPGGRIFSHDGHLPLCIEVFRDEALWREIRGSGRPRIEGLGTRKLVQVVKGDAGGITQG